MSGKEKERNFTKTDSEAKKSKAKKKNKKKRKPLSVVWDSAEIVTDGKPFLDIVVPSRLSLRSITAYIGHLSQAEVEVVVRKEGVGVTEEVAFTVQEGFNNSEIAIDIPEPCIVKVYLKHPGDFRAEEVYFSALVFNK